MRWIQETEAKEQIAELLQEVERGESIAIVRNGIKIATLVPSEELDWDSEEARERRQQRRREAIKEFRDWRRTQEPTGVTVEEFMEWRREGHKY